MKKKLKKLYSFIVCLAIITASITALPANAIAATTVSFSDKIIFENDVLGETSTYGLNNTSTEQEEPESLSVTLRFEESFSCDCGEITSDEELTFHRAEVKAHYKALNERIVNELDLEDYEGLSCSNYGPFIEFYYPTYSDFISNDYDILEDKNPSTMKCVYIRNNYGIEEEATISIQATAPSLQFHDIDNDNDFNDSVFGITDIPENRTYHGNGIKIGLLDVRLPSITGHLNGISYSTYGNRTGDHASLVSAVLGGNSGIADEASLYFTSVYGERENAYAYSFYKCCEWLIDNDVNVINMSMYILDSYGVYDSWCAYADYIVENLKVTWVKSAGNFRGSNDTTTLNYISSPGAALNLITVASNDANLKIAQSSSYLLKPAWENQILKPTLTAPGVKITGIEGFSAPKGGTSVATPVVTGIVALLMEEFPDLKYAPEEVMAILTSSCTPVHGQTTIVDEDAGFGIVNYTNARIAYHNCEGYVLARSYAANEIITSKNIPLQLSKKTLVVITLFENPIMYEPDPSVSPSPIFTPVSLKIELTRQNSSEITIIHGTQKGNICYALIPTVEEYLSANAKIYAYDAKTTTDVEWGSLCYYTFN